MIKDRDLHSSESPTGSLVGCIKKVNVLIHMPFDSTGAGYHLTANCLFNCVRVHNAQLSVNVGDHVPEVAVFGGKVARIGIGPKESRKPLDEFVKCWECPSKLNKKKVLHSKCFPRISFSDSNDISLVFQFY